MQKVTKRVVLNTLKYYLSDIRDSLHTISRNDYKNRIYWSKVGNKKYLNSNFICKESIKGIPMKLRKMELYQKKVQMQRAALMMYPLEICIKLDPNYLVKKGNPIIKLILGLKRSGLIMVERLSRKSMLYSNNVSGTVVISMPTQTKETYTFLKELKNYSKDILHDGKIFMVQKLYEGIISNARFFDRRVDVGIINKLIENTNMLKSLCVMGVILSVILNFINFLILFIMSLTSMMFMLFNFREQQQIKKNN